MDLVYTTKGLVPLNELEVTDVTSIEGQARVTATEWRKDGELVRRDVHVNLLRGLEMNGQQGSI